MTTISVFPYTLWGRYWCTQTSSLDEIALFACLFSHSQLPLPLTIYPPSSIHPPQEHVLPYGGLIISVVSYLHKHWIIAVVIV